MYVVVTPDGTLTRIDEEPDLESALLRALQLAGPDDVVARIRNGGIVRVYPVPFCPEIDAHSIRADRLSELTEAVAAA